MEKKTVLITGAAGGLGQAVVSEFSERGWKVFATDLEAEILKTEYSDPGVRKMTMDVSSDESVKAAFEQLRAVEIDLIINNAGIDGYFTLCEAPVDQFRRMFEVNVFGSYRVNQVFLPCLRRPGGRIIHVSSESVKINVPFMTYPVTKQTLEGYCRTLRQELQFIGIDVTLVRPGAIRTPFLENVRHMKNPVVNSLLSGPFDRFSRQAPKEIGKIAEPEVVASFIYKICQKRKTKLIYPINNDPKLALAGLLPFSFLEKMVYKRLG
ncbi:MAG: SDR family NAD(P)-dependent oxidoreductase [Bacteroidetes bacterium]|nr:SDR family NAD(P)-dependent oxidoreductase [Bacteroidota bacterium]